MFLFRGRKRSSDGAERGKKKNSSWPFFPSLTDSPVTFSRARRDARAVGQASSSAGPHAMLALPAECGVPDARKRKLMNRSPCLLHARTHGPPHQHRPSAGLHQLRLARSPPLWLNTVLALRRGPFFHETCISLQFERYGLDPLCASLPAICSQKPVSLLSILSHAESCLESILRAVVDHTCWPVLVDPSIAIGTSTEF